MPSKKQRAKLIDPVLGWHGRQPSSRRDAASHPSNRDNDLNQSESIKFNADDNRVGQC
ncbi:hypothetical protein [Novipirellula aureliae]|uniref:hypothetical protein n=1 Tax=Novipirellula aureliae TaxID=2527966 RepID=UPI0018CED84C|nr:hypothetical protein [Novipirellula aureliae]